MATIKPEAVNDLKAQIDLTTTDPDGIPGVQYFAVNRNGDYIFEHVAGKIGLGQQQDMQVQTSLWLASCTKLITVIACMQLVEQGKLALDDADLVAKICPELKDVKVLLENGKLVERTKDITLRMLLIHTAGFCYSFLHPGMASHTGAIGTNEFSGRADDILQQPLIFQPGEGRAYGINLDWVGVLIMRTSGLSLGEYFQQHVTGPLGIDKDISFLPDEEMRRDLAYLHQRDPAGKLKIREDGHMFRAPLVATSPEETKLIFHSGGAGCFGRPRAFCQLIATLLNGGVHAPTQSRLLKPETVNEMFTNQIPHMPDFGRQAGSVPKPSYVNESPELYPEPGNPPQGWGISFFLHLQDSMTHSKGTAWWTGLPNLFWWCDRAKGIGGIIGSQILPHGDTKVVELWAAIERGLYANLVSPESSS